MISLIPRDERESVVDLAADRLSFLVVCYGALLIAAFRSLVLGQETWDLLALVVLGGAVGLAYRLQRGVVTRPFSVLLFAAMIGAAAVALGFVWLGFSNR